MGVGIRSVDLPGVRRLMEAVLDPLSRPSLDAWRRDVTRSLIDVLGVDKASMQLAHPDGDLVFTETFSAQAMGHYAKHYIPELNRRMAYSDRIREMGYADLSTFWREDLPWMYRSAYYNEFVAPERAFDPVWASAPVPGQSLPAVLLTHRDTRRGTPQGARTLAIMETLRPALSAAVSLVAQAQTWSRDLAHLLDSLEGAALLLARGGRVVHRNSAASGLLSRAPERDMLTRVAGALVRDSGALESGAAAYDPTNSVRSIDTQQGRVTLSATRVGQDNWGGSPLYIVLLKVAPPSAPDSGQVAKRWRLTPRQTEVASLLRDRKTDREIAVELSISPYTARHHVESVLSKLGVRSRLDVAAVLAGGSTSGPAGT